MLKPTDFAYHLTNYLSKYLPGLVGVSPNTIKSYRDTFSLFLRYCKDEKNLPSERFMIKNLTKALTEDFLSWVELNRSCGVSTRNQRLSAIHAFCKYLQYECPELMEPLQEVISVPFKKKETKAFEYLTLEGVQAILSQPDLSTRKGHRDLTMLALMYDSGARVQEIADLIISDIRFSEPATVRLTGKGRKTRIVPLMSKTAALLRKYIDSFYADKPDSQPLFQNNKRDKLTRSGIAFILSNYAESARKTAADIIPAKVSPHAMRHSKAMHLLQSGVNLVYIRDVLGHNAIKTTEVYARADTKMKRMALENADKPDVPVDTPAWQKSSDLLDWLQSLGR